MGWEKKAKSAVKKGKKSVKKGIKQIKKTSDSIGRQLEDHAKNPLRHTMKHAAKGLHTGAKRIQFDRAMKGVGREIERGIKQVNREMAHSFDNPFEVEMPDLPDIPPFPEAPTYATDIYRNNQDRRRRGSSTILTGAGGLKTVESTGSTILGS